MFVVYLCVILFCIASGWTRIPVGTKLHLRTRSQPIAMRSEELHEIRPVLTKEAENLIKTYGQPAFAHGANAALDCARQASEILTNSISQKVEDFRPRDLCRYMFLIFGAIEWMDYEADEHAYHFGDYCGYSLDYSHLAPDEGEVRREVDTYQAPVYVNDKFYGTISLLTLWTVIKSTEPDHISVRDCETLGRCWVFGKMVIPAQELVPFTNNVVKLLEIVREHRQAAKGRHRSAFLHTRKRCKATCEPDSLFYELTRYDHLSDEELDRDVLWHHLHWCPSGWDVEEVVEDYANRNRVFGGDSDDSYYDDYYDPNDPHSS